MSQFSDAQPPMLPLVFSAALIALAVAYSVDAEALASKPTEAGYSLQALASTVPPYEPPTLAPSAIVLNAVPAYRTEQGMVKFFFAPSKTDVAPSAHSALQDIVTAVKAGQRVQISGFHDSTGNAQINTELAKKRAQAVHKQLVDLGAPASAIDLKKPALAMDAIHNHAEARRVEVVLIP